MSRIFRDDELVIDVSKISTVGADHYICEGVYVKCGERVAAQLRRFFGAYLDISEKMRTVELHNSAVAVNANRAILEGVVDLLSRSNPPVAVSQSVELVQ